MSPRASQKQIAEAYKTLAQIFHPDRFIDAPDNVREEAERRMKNLNEAYAMARKGGGASQMSGSGPGPSGPRAQKMAPAWEEAARQRVAAAARGVPWREGVRARAMAEAKAKEARAKRERAATNGQAIPRPKNRRDPVVLYGMGEALHTNKLSCRGCQSIQWLPSGWSDVLNHTNYFCSVCGRLLLSK
ncbi:MAG: J domain-containing protein [Actinomycetota bacterium]|nr:J domain-containing protein [Actinomycetota bacterium]